MLFANLDRKFLFNFREYVLNRQRRPPAFSYRFYCVMKKSFFKFNLFFFGLNLILIFGIIFLWQKMFILSPVTKIYDDKINILIDNLSDQEVVENTEDTEIGEEGTEVIEDNIEQYDNESASSTLILDTKEDIKIPNKINLNVPFTSQAPEKNWEEPWQDACEEAGVLMLDAYYKGYGLSPLFARDEILKMVAWEEARGWEMSITAEKVAELGEWYVFTTHDSHNTTQTVTIVENPNVEEIKRFVAGGDPVLVLAYGKVLPNPHFRNGGPEYHALIIRGYDEDEFITNDPGTQFGENFKYKYNDLMNAIHDWNDGRVSEGRKVILVIQ